MSLVQTIKQYPEMKKITVEADVRTLLSEVRRDLISLNIRYKFKDYSLTKILEFVEKGAPHFYPSKDGRIDEEDIKIDVDLSEARKILAEYRRLSKVGCESCVNLGRFKPYANETDFYCTVNESKGDVDDNMGKSPFVIEYWNKKDCPNLERKFKKTIEEIISE